MPLSQKKKSFLRYIFGVQPLPWLTTVCHELKTRVFFFSPSFFGPKQNGGTMNSQAFPSSIAPFQAFFELWHKHAPVYQKTPSFLPGSKKTECYTNAGQPDLPPFSLAFITEEISKLCMQNSTVYKWSYWFNWQSTHYIGKIISLKL